MGPFNISVHTFFSPYDMRVRSLWKSVTADTFFSLVGSVLSLYTILTQAILHFPEHVSEILGLDACVAQ